MVTLLRRVNAALNHVGAFITRVTGTMWMAIAFAIIAFVSLPDALKSGSLIIIVGWVAQTMFQLVLLPIIMVGQNLQAAKVEARDAAHAAEVEARDIETHNTVMADSAEKHAASAEERAEMTEMLTDLRELVKAAIK